MCARIRVPAFMFSLKKFSNLYIKKPTGVTPDHFFNILNVILKDTLGCS